MSATENADGDAFDGGRVLVLNPAAGGGKRIDEVRERARSYGFDVRETSEAGDAVEIARSAANQGTELLAAAGGDGTLNEVVRGIEAADAFEQVVLGVIPTGTGNNFAGNVGVNSVDEAFLVLQEGERRTIDLGFAGGRPFLNSCIGGITAEASGKTDPEMKERLGVVAYLVTTVQEAISFDGVELTIETSPDAAEVWSGDALAVLIGNGRRFPGDGDTQANMEDGLLDVTIVENRSPSDLAGEATISRLLGTDNDAVSRLKTPSLELTTPPDDPAHFSLDGEMTTANHLVVDTQPSVLQLLVGEGYEPNPNQ